MAGGVRHSGGGGGGAPPDKVREWCFSKSLAGFGSKSRRTLDVGIGSSSLAPLIDGPAIFLHRLEIGP